MLQMQTSKDEDDKTDLIQNFALDHVNCIGRLDLKGDRLACERLTEDLGRHRISKLDQCVYTQTVY